MGAAPESTSQLISSSPCTVTATWVPVMPHFTDGWAVTSTPGRPRLFILSRNAALSSTSSSRAAMSISPAAPMPQSR